MQERMMQSNEGYAGAENRRQVSRFLVIGGLSVAVDFAVYLFLIGSLGFATHTAKGLSYAVGMVLGFVGNKYWTFGSVQRSATEPITYGVLYATTLLVNIGVNAAVLAVFGLGAKLFAFLVATATTTVLNFLGMRLVTFRAGIQDRLAAERAEEASPAAAGEPCSSPRGSRSRELANG